jgi:hypothetical protein
LCVINVTDKFFRFKLFLDFDVFFLPATHARASRFSGAFPFGELDSNTKLTIESLGEIFCNSSTRQSPPSQCIVISEKGAREAAQFFSKQKICQCLGAYMCHSNRFGMARKGKDEKCFSDLHFRFGAISRGKIVVESVVGADVLMGDNGF